MPDRESIMQALKDSLMNQHCGFIENVGNVYAVSEETINNILELLKEREPVLLKNQHKSGGHFINANSPWKSKCPRCEKKIEGRQTRFCKYCGQEVRWE